MAVVAFNTAFVPTISVIIGNPFFHEGLFLGAFSPYPGEEVTNIFIPKFYGSNGAC